MKVRVKVGSVNKCWTHPALITRTNVGDILPVRGPRGGGRFEGDPIYYVVTTTDGLSVCLFEDEVEVVSE